MHEERQVLVILFRFMRWLISSCASIQHFISYYLIHIDPYLPKIYQLLSIFSLQNSMHNSKLNIYFIIIIFHNFHVEPPDLIDEPSLKNFNFTIINFHIQDWRLVLCRCVVENIFSFTWLLTQRNVEEFEDKTIAQIFHY